MLLDGRSACRDFLFNYADELGIQRRAIETAPGTFFVIMTIPGSRPELPAIMLYSHTDVVPTFREHWTHDPYSAYKDEEGNIFARGAQDMKCVGVQYMEALRNWFAKGVKKWSRTIHIVWGPDEEIGHVNGMKGFSLTDEFKALNVDFALDEGIAAEDDVYKVFYAERIPWWVKVTLPGNPGHGSKFIEKTAVEKLQKLLASVDEFRNEQKALLTANPDLTIGDVTTSNVTIINGGVQVNVVPEKFEAYIDIRVTPLQDLDVIRARVDRWAEEAGEGVTYEFMQFSNFKLISPNTREDPFWAAIDDGLKKEGCNYKKEIFIGATDSRFVRAPKRMTELGFTADNATPTLPITAICIVGDKNKSPRGFVPVVKCHDDQSDADLWRDGFFAINRQVRYICTSTEIPDTIKTAVQVVTNLIIVRESDPIPHGYVAIDYTADSREKSLRKKWLCIRTEPRDRVVDAIGEIIIMGKSKKVPRDYTSAGEIDSLLVCYKVVAIPQTYGIPTSNSSSALETKPTSGGLYPGLPNPNIYNSTPSNLNVTGGSNSSAFTLKNVGIPRVKAIDGIDFKLNPSFVSNDSDRDSQLPDLSQFAHLEMNSDRYNYNFATEHAVVS
uniref:N-acyl-aliphatic-L-amino acid amidohydrolase n=1 Tax=Caenorhabditis japonica TaxID=281687 RepID=A0A8R1DRD2_CAEJA